MWECKQFRIAPDRFMIAGNKAGKERASLMNETEQAHIWQPALRCR
jgi:hypothetical protein